ncbi:MerR family DNA-binding transcriptional regulator [Paracoccus suum]|uniref:MerR family DNA-binding transcriptional regulator n=2 Tax=Paracoccus suum TaxID=2259340 RepID=A0A344PIA7_9RHOB|nr:MerR family DNA-binding transcriptional regulator [Paracoccus suum]
MTSAASLPDPAEKPDPARAPAAAPASDDSLMTIRQMCAAFDVTARALRFYESRDLLAPLRRGQQRLYGRRDRARLTLIVRGKRFGFSLEQIRQLLDLYEPSNRNHAQTEAALAVARARLADMEAQRRDLGLAIAELNDLIAIAERQIAASAPEKSN